MAGLRIVQIELADIERAMDRIAACGDTRFVTAETIARAVKEHNGNQSAAARALGMSRSTLRDRLRAYA